MNFKQYRLLYIQHNTTHILLAAWEPLSVRVSTGSSVLGTEDDLAVSLRFMNFGASPPSSDDSTLDSGLSSFVENPQYFCGIIKDKDMCECLTIPC